MFVGSYGAVKRRSDNLLEQSLRRDSARLIYVFQKAKIPYNLETGSQKEGLF